jgi:hypothetical protein
VAIRLHHEDRVLLGEAIAFTAAETGFIPRLLEKDYFCSVVLEQLCSGDTGLIFKGGTCLSKIHGSFYRLSEDLDFSIPTAADAARAERSRRARAVRAAVDALPRHLSGLQIVEPLVGANNSTQYCAVVGYESLLDGHVEPIRIEVGLREPIFRDPPDGLSCTALLHPADGQALVDPFTVRCLSYEELMAEKLRAALTRRDVAIRDFFDVDQAVCGGKLRVQDDTLVDLVRRKLAIPGAGVADVSDGRMRMLERQLEAELRPVLREREFVAFDLERAVMTIRAIANALGVHS